MDSIRIDDSGEVEVIGESFEIVAEAERLIQLIIPYDLRFSVLPASNLSCLTFQWMAAASYHKIEQVHEIKQKISTILSGKV